MKTYAFTTTGGSTVDPAVAVVNGVASVDINLTVTEDGHSQSFMWARAGQAVSAGRLAEARQVALGATALLTGTLTTTLDTVQASAHATRYLPAGATTGTVRGAQNLGTDTVTIAPQGTDTIDGGTAPYQLDPGKVIRLQSDGSGSWVEYASSGSGAAAVPDGSITLPKLATGVQTSIGKADGSAQKASNLSDVANAGTARTNLGLGTAATLASSAVAQTANNLSDVASASTSRTNLGLGTAAVMSTTQIAADTALTSTYARLLTTDAVSTSASGTLAAWHLTPVDATSGAATWTLPAANSVTAGVETAVKKADTSANTVTVQRAGSDLIFGTGSGSTSKALTLAGEAITFVSNGTDRWTIQTSDTPSGVLASTYVQRRSGTSTPAAPLPFVNVRDYGAKGDAATDDTAAFQAAAAILTAGGILYVPTGTYFVSGKVTITKPIVVQGDLRGVDGSALASVIITPSAVTGNLFEVTADNASFRDLNITNYGDQTSTNTAQSIAICFVSGRSQSVERCRISNFYINVDWQNCDWWRMTGNVITKASQYGVRIRNIALPDSGDSFFTDNFVVGAASAPWNTVALIRQESGGGTKFTNNKVISGQTGYQLAVPDGVATSVSLFTNNSFEGQAVSAVDVLHQGPSNTGAWTRISFVGNEFLGNLCTQSAFRVRPSAAGLIQQLSIIGNQFSGASGVSTIDIDNTSEVTVSDNYINGGVNGILLGSGTRGWYIRDNHISGVSAAFVKNAAYFQWQWSDNSICELERSRSIFNTSTTVPTAVAAVGMPNATACLVEVIFSGQVQGGSSPGACGGYFQRMVTQAANGGTPTITTVGTDVTTGQPFTLTFTAGTSAVTVNVGRSASDGGATDVAGTCFVRVRGAAYSI